MSSSMDKTPIFNEEEGNNSFEVIFNETLSLVATLYKSKAKGTFQEKSASLVVRTKKKSTLRGQIYQALGIAEMDLSSIADDVVNGTVSSLECRFPLTKGYIDGAYLDVTVTPKLMTADGSSDLQDDTMSMQSGFSDAPVMSADFDNIASIPKYPPSAQVTTPEKVTEGNENGDLNAAVRLALHNKSIELASLKEDHDSLATDHTHCQEQLEEAREALKLLRVKVERQVEDAVRESETARMTLTRVSAAANMVSSDDEEYVKLRAEQMTALYSELEAQKNLHAVFLQSVQVKEARWVEAETRNLHLLEKVNDLAKRNVALKAALANTLPKQEYEEKRKISEDELKRQISDLQSTKDYAETELQLQIEINNDLKRRLQLYSENIAELEVNGIAKANNNNSTSPRQESSPTKRTTERRASARRDSLDGNGETVTFEGPLTKRGSFYPSWKNRHFILHGDAHLSYYTNQEDMVFKGHFVITKDTVLGQAKVSGFDCFFLEHSKRRLYMTAATPLEEIEWMSVFRQSITALKEK